jgi:polyribonucleotide nucleotidyltransferase
MAIMDAGIPYPKPVAGIAMGLIKEGDRVSILSDILGDEDHLGDMDFKVAGTKDGITGIQMDIKIEGVTTDIMKTALAQAREGRIHILGEMAKAITETRPEMSKFAPRITTLKIPVDKIREVIGTGGKVIKDIVAKSGAKVDINDDGVINIATSDMAARDKALEMINNIIATPEVGAIYKGKVKKIVEFGAFIGIMPNQDGLLHVSEIAHERVNRVEDFLKEGDEVEVKVLEVDRMGKVRLSRKVLLPLPPGGAAPSGGGGGGGPRRDGGGDRPRGGGGGGPIGGGGGKPFPPRQ